MKDIEIFENSAHEYDKWFDINKLTFESEVLALRRFIPKKGRGLEIGAGTGRFSVPFGIQVGVEPAEAMARIARKRGIKLYRAKAEKLPFANQSFDFVSIITTICFLQDPVQALQEATRVLRPGGDIIIGMIDNNSPLGKIYEAKKKHSKFYKYANFYAVNEVLNWLKELRYNDIKICQTIFNLPNRITTLEPVKDRYGEGGFVVIAAKKECENRFVQAEEGLVKEKRK